ncbi:MAG: hypothetical protein WBR26_15295 [Candidatus Acidiferrum sp.]
MALLHYRRIERRRTARATMCVNLLVHGVTEQGDKFKYWTRTVSVSEHGGVLVEAGLAMGQKFYIVNEYNGKKATATIVSIRNTKEGEALASFEFEEGVQRFWSMTFPAAGAKPLRRFVARVAEKN